MAHTRVILAGLPRLLEEIVTATIAAEEDLELTGSLSDPSRFRGAGHAMDADVLVIGEDDPTAVVSLLERHPRLKVLAVTEDGQDSWLYTLRAERLSTGNLSPETLVAAVRRASEPLADTWRS